MVLHDASSDAMLIVELVLSYSTPVFICLLGVGRHPISQLDC